MFLKIRNIKEKKYISIVQSYRENGKVRHRELLSLGLVDKLIGNKNLEALTKKLIELHNWNLIEMSEINEVKEKYCYGMDVYKRLWEEYGYDKLMKKIERQRKIQFDLNEVIFLQVISRLLKPSSRLSLWKEQKRYLLKGEIELHDIYRSLDIISEEKGLIEWYTFDKYRNIFNSKIDVVFYDCTTFHFESVRVDKIREFGYSKSGNFNEVQVIMGLLIDKEGHPIGFNLFPGNTSESDTFIEALETLKKRFIIDRIIFVADKALNSKKHIYLLQENGYKYIVSSRIKNASKKIVEKIFDQQDYKTIIKRKDYQENQKKEEMEDEIYKYKTIESVEHRFKDENGGYKKFENRLIVTWSEKRRKFDEIERERMVEKAKKKFEEKESIQYKRGWKKYLKLNTELKPVAIDTKKIENDAKWDGYYGIETNIFSDELKEYIVIENLHNLWKIEQTYRIYKTTLEAEPVFVWNPERIIGHFVICFLALVLERALEMKLLSRQIKTSAEQIRMSLNNMELFKLTIKNNDYFLRAKIDKLGEEILRTFKIQQPPNLSLVK